MQEKWLPGTLRDRIRDLCRSMSISQSTLAQELGIDKSTLSRFLTEKTNKLSSEYVVMIAGYFGVSTDFLLGLTNIPARKNHDIEVLGLSAEAAVNLAQNRVNQEVVCHLLESPRFAELTRQIALYQQGMLASGVAAQNQFFGSMSNLLLEHGKANPGDKAAAKDAIQHVRVQAPVYADEVENLTRSFQQVLLEMKPQSAERVKQTAATMKDSLKGLTDTLPRDSGGLSISPDGILGMIATGLEQVEVPEAYRPEMASPPIP